MWTVNKRYLNNDNFASKRKVEKPYQASQADQQILNDKDPNFRVFNQTVSTFNDASTSYFHKSIGGYHGAKLKRYQELIENHIAKGNMAVLNMLNTKYFISQQGQVQQNPGALGNAWFVNNVNIVANAGQIVGYPILDLDNFFTDIHKYLRFLEEAVILTLREYGLEAERSKGETGVWLDVGTEKARKICAFGVKSSRWVTMHGFAFNVNADLSYFGNIIPCGIVDKKVTSLENEIGRKIAMEEVKNKLKTHLVYLFEMEII